MCKLPQKPHPIPYIVILIVPRQIKHIITQQRRLFWICYKQFHRQIQRLQFHNIVLKER